MNGRARIFLALLIGGWIGAGAFVFYAVGYNFAGLPKILESHPELRARADLDPEDHAALRRSPLWVFAGELNRAYFRTWNRAQLVLAALCLLTAWLARSSRGTLLALVPAAAIVCVLTFYLAPEITRLGRSLDFAPRDPPPPGFAEFSRLHGIYLVAELAKTALLVIGAAAIVWAAPRRAEERLTA